MTTVARTSQLDVTSGITADILDAASPTISRPLRSRWPAGSTPARRCGASRRSGNRTRTTWRSSSCTR